MSMIVHASMFVDAFVQWGRPFSGATRHGGEPSSFHWIVLTRIPGGLCPSDWDVLRYPWRGQLPGFGPLVFSSGLWNLVGIMTHRLLWTFLHVHILGLLRAALWIRARSALQSCSCAPGRTFRLTVHLESSWALKSHQVTRLHACRSLPDGIILCKQFSLDFDWSHNSEIANKSILSTSENEMMENSSANFPIFQPFSSWFPGFFSPNFQPTPFHGGFAGVGCWSSWPGVRMNAKVMRASFLGALGDWAISKIPKYHTYPEAKTCHYYSVIIKWFFTML